MIHLFFLSEFGHSQASGAAARTLVNIAMATALILRERVCVRVGRVSLVGTRDGATAGSVSIKSLD